MVCVFISFDLITTPADHEQLVNISSEALILNSKTNTQKTMQTITWCYKFALLCRRTLRTGAPAPLRVTIVARWGVGNRAWVDLPRALGEGAKRLDLRIVWEGIIDTRLVFAAPVISTSLMNIWIELACLLCVDCEIPDCNIWSISTLQLQHRISRFEYWCSHTYRKNGQIHINL